jgi:16S rRNA (guanine966-N2)-methyltransferase
MRVIAGKYKGHNLRTVTGLTVRPTSDRLRETVFNILQPQIMHSQFLDLCAGSGAIGIEALSRGAATVTFIESQRLAIQAILANLAHCKITTAVELLRLDAIVALKQLQQRGAQFDLVYVDPPYQSPIYLPVLTLLSNARLLSPTARVLVEHHRKSPLPTSVENLGCYRQINQGETAINCYQYQHLAAIAAQPDPAAELITAAENDHCPDE